jgi:hypothetical protein
MHILPVYKNYTVDIRLKEFRKAIFGKPLVFIPFDSPKGKKLLEGFLKTHEGMALL